MTFHKVLTEQYETLSHWRRQSYQNLALKEPCSEYLRGIGELKGKKILSKLILCQNGSALKGKNLLPRANGSTLNVNWVLGTREPGTISEK